MALTDYIDKILPAWASNTKLEHWFKLGFVLAAEIDALIDMADDLATASMPGQVEIPNGDGYRPFPMVDALAITGRERRVQQGLAESFADYAGRQRGHLDQARRAGTAFAILEQVAGILQPNPPILRLVTSEGVWYTREPDRSYLLHNQNGRGFRLDGPTGSLSPITTAAQPWDWDSKADPPTPDMNEAGRIWLIVYAPCNLPFLASNEGRWGSGAGSTRYGDGKGTVDVGTIGISAPLRWVELVRSAAHEWRAAGLRLSHIIVAYDLDSFLPTWPVGLPDGTWAHHGHIANGVRQPARLATARYIRGVPGLGY